MNKILRILTITTASTLLLTGCETTKNTFSKLSWPKWNSDKPGQLSKKDTCPSISIMPELGSITQQRGGNVVSETVIQSVTTTCNSSPTAATIRISLGFNGQLGPEGIKDAKVEANYSIPYLVAVINPKGEIISKDVFAITMVYKNGQTQQSYPDLLEQTIPLNQGESAGLYKIMVGFQLNDEELAYNRSAAAKIPVK